MVLTYVLSSTAHCSRSGGLVAYGAADAAGGDGADCGDDHDRQTSAAGFARRRSEAHSDSHRVGAGSRFDVDGNGAEQPERRSIWERGRCGGNLERSGPGGLAERRAVQHAAGFVDEGNRPLRCAARRRTHPRRNRPGAGPPLAGLGGVQGDRGIHGLQRCLWKPRDHRLRGRLHDALRAPQPDPGNERAGGGQHGRDRDVGFDGLLDGRAPALRDPAERRAGEPGELPGLPHRAGDAALGRTDLVPIFADGACCDGRPDRPAHGDASAADGDADEHADANADEHTDANTDAEEREARRRRPLRSRSTSKGARQG